MNPLNPLERVRRMQFFWQILGRRECELPPQDLLVLFQNAANFGGTTVDDLLTEEELAVAQAPLHHGPAVSPYAATQRGNAPCFA
jgi:hypothetical protein